MKSFKMAKVMGLILTLAIVATGCKSGGTHDATAAAELKAALTNMQSIRVAEYSMVVEGELTAQEKAEDEETNVEFKFDFSGAENSEDMENLQLSMMIDATGSLNGGEEEMAKGEVRIANDKLFFMLAELSDFDQDAMTMAMIQPSLGKWWYVAMPAELVAEMKKYDTGATDEANMTPEEKEMKDLLDKTEFFKNVEKGGEEDFDGVTTVKYSAELDKDAFKAYLKEAGEIAGEEMSDAEFAEVERVLNFGDVNLAFWVATEDQTIRKMTGDMEVTADKDQEEMEKFDMSLSFEMTQTNLGGDISVYEPEGAQMFDLMGMMMGGMGTQDMMMEGGTELDEPTLYDANGLPIDAEIEVEAVIQ